MSNPQIPLPVIYITSKALLKLQGYISLVPGEISGLGEVEGYGEGDFLVTDLMLFEQDCGPGETGLDMDKVTDFQSAAMDKGRDLGKIKLWWHSHGEGFPFWSPRDKRTIEALKNSGWMLFIVGSKRFGFQVRLDVFKPIRLTLDGLRLMHLETGDTVSLARLRKEVAKKVRILPPAPILAEVKYVPTD